MWRRSIELCALLLRSAAVAILIVQVGWPAAALEAMTQTCALQVSEARFRLDHLREEERLAPIKLIADQAIFELFEPLWAARSTERLRYLAAKHARDRSRFYVDRATIRAKRTAAELEVLTRESFSSKKDPREALRRFDVLECDFVR